MQKKRVVTLTLNPAVDEHYEDLGCGGGPILVGRDRGGKGINTSRALLSAGVESVCFVAIGENGADEFLCAEDLSGLNIRAKRVRGGVRTNRHIHTPSGDRAESGSSEPIPDTDIASLLSELSELLGEGDILAICGSAPEGTNISLLVGMLVTLRERGVRVIVDSRTLSIDDIAAIRPVMIKPNAEEAEHYLGYSPSDENVCLALRELAARSNSDVLLTLGGDGALLYSDGRIYRARARTVGVKSTTGAGDSTVCAYIIASLRSMCAADTLRLAVAFGSAACETEGSAPPDPCRVYELYRGTIAEHLE